MTTDQLIDLDLKLGLFEGTRAPLSVTLLDILESEAPSEGFWYFVRYPDRWKTVAVRYDNQSVEHNMTHPEYWENQLVPELAKAWGLDSWGAKELKDYPYGFPRGRVTKAGRWIIQWGNNMPEGVSFSKEGVEALFSLSLDHKVKWEVDDHEVSSVVDKDDHEVSSVVDKDAVRKLLGIKEDWPAQNFMGESCGPSILRKAKSL